MGPSQGHTALLLEQDLNPGWLVCRTLLDTYAICGVWSSEPRPARDLLGPGLVGNEKSSRKTSLEQNKMLQLGEGCDTSGCQLFAAVKCFRWWGACSHFSWGGIFIAAQAPSHARSSEEATGEAFLPS